METIYLQLEQQEGALAVRARRGEQQWEHHVPDATWQAAEKAARLWTEQFENGYRPLQNSAALAHLGQQLKEQFFAEFYEEMLAGSGQIVMSSDRPDVLNLPWELLPHGNNFLGTGEQWRLRRTLHRGELPQGELGPGAAPLRVLFMSCAPLDQVGLDFEKEEEAILRLTSSISSKLHLHIAETGTFDELKNIIAELKPHVVHLSGHGIVQDGVGRFCFETDRGATNLRDVHEMGQQLFAGSSVRLVFVNACQSSQAAAAGLCQTLTRDGYAPLALGWAASIADDRATQFARRLYHDLSTGHKLDSAIAAARREILHEGRRRHDGVELLDASFALPQLYAALSLDELVDTRRQDPPEIPTVRYELLGDEVRGLREGFVGRRRELQKTRPPLRDGDAKVLLLTGIGGAGKSTLATRLANRFQLEGYRVVALRARDEDKLGFGLRLVTEAADVCYELGLDRHEKMLRDGERPLTDRLRLLVKVLNETKILLVLDNLESLLNEPPAPPGWKDETVGAFFEHLTKYLTGTGRAILTCRYVPEDYDASQSQLAHLALPDFAAPDFFKYLRRHPGVAARIEKGELPRDLLETFYRKLGATPRFLEQACVILQRTGADELEEQLATIELEGVEENKLAQLQQKYFASLFLPRLLDALPLPAREALCRLALIEPPLPLDGMAQVTGMDEIGAAQCADLWLRLGLAQRFDELGEVPLYAVYPLQRTFLTAPSHLSPEAMHATHTAAAAFFQESYKRERGRELGLAVSEELVACLYHATKASDLNQRIWAVVRLSNLLHRQAEFRAALELTETLLTETRHPELLGQAGRALSSLGDWPEARQYYQEALKSQEVSDTFIAFLWHSLATIDLREGRYGQAYVGFEKSLEIKQAIGDRGGEAATWHQLATIDLNEGKYAEARVGFEKSLEIEQAIGNRVGEATTWHQLASIDLNEGKYVEARVGFEKSLEIMQAIGDRVGEAATWHQLATIDVYEEKYAEARVGFEKSLEIEQAIGNRVGEANTRHNLASIDLNEGKYVEARVGFEKSLEIKQAIGDRAGEAGTFSQIGFIAWEKGRQATGIRLFVLSFALLQAIGAAEQHQVWSNLVVAAGALKLNQVGFDFISQQVVEAYKRDQGAELVRQALEDLE